MASRLFSPKIRTHIYTIYGLTRVADEIVDTYKGPQAARLLKDLEQEVYDAIERKYSTNPLVHAFQQTVHEFIIDQPLIAAFFKSMHTDLTKKTFNRSEYDEYIYGSAEVIGLMCLKVFCNGNENLYNRQKNGAAQLGAGYQKVNFLRDLHADHLELGRCYFPDVTYETMTEAQKIAIVKEIRQDFKTALPAIDQLPSGARRAVLASYRYYDALLTKLAKTPIETIKKRRVRVNNLRKIMLLV